MTTAQHRPLVAITSVILAHRLSNKRSEDVTLSRAIAELRVNSLHAAKTKVEAEGRGKLKSLSRRVLEVQRAAALERLAFRRYIRVYTEVSRLVAWWTGAMEASQTLSQAVQRTRKRTSSRSLKQRSLLSFNRILCRWRNTSLQNCVQLFSLNKKKEQDHNRALRKTLRQSANLQSQNKQAGAMLVGRFVHHLNTLLSVRVVANWALNKVHSIVGSSSLHLNKRLESDAIDRRQCVMKRIIKRMRRQESKAAAVAVIAWISNLTDLVDGRKLMMRMVAKWKIADLTSVCTRWKQKVTDFKKEKWKELQEMNHNLQAEMASLRAKLKTSNDELGELQMQVLVQSSTA